jgi:hypothetical protein
VVNGQRLTFDVWRLDRDVFLMRDRETGTIWSHLDGTASTGPLEGSRLGMVPLAMMTWEEWKSLYPDTLVISADTEFKSFYRPVRLGRYNPNEARYGDQRLASNALVVAVEVDQAFRGYPMDGMEQEHGVINDLLAGEPIVVLFNPVSHTGLAFSRRVGHETLEFYNANPTGFDLRDRGTDSRWSVLGQALDGAWEGTKLAFVPSFISEWYGWSAYHPETELYQRPQ